MRGVGRGGSGRMPLGCQGMWCWSGFPVRETGSRMWSYAFNTIGMARRNECLECKVFVGGLPNDASSEEVTL
ncbi:unnamed protein product [Acanthocheilonema viteae]|uniref:RRM domain-containing protein n=1 Tax=Acanthocheilonema viteae TaxID=6277 RepID=A0A498SN36_ACAVI|nr:unnamed protein product [Acanthocheilonema viteae]